jgi:hypothetical protein
MDLFEMRDGVVYPSLHALLIEPFKGIWAADTTEGKFRTLRKFRYVELLCSPKKSNVFYNYSEEVRPEKVKVEVFNDKDYVLGDDVMQMTIKYKELLSSTSPYYEELLVSEQALAKIKTFLKNFNMDSRTNSGGLVLKPKEALSAIAELPEARDSVERIRAKVVADLKEETKTRNSREVGFFER